MRFKLGVLGRTCRRQLVSQGLLKLYSTPRHLSGTQIAPNGTRKTIKTNIVHLSLISFADCADLVLLGNTAIPNLEHYSSFVIDRKLIDNNAAAGIVLLSSM